MQSSSSRLQARSKARSAVPIQANFFPTHVTKHNVSSADRTAPSALAAAHPAPASRLQQQQQQQQQQRGLVAAAAAKKQAARSTAGKGFGNPDKLASKASSNANRKCPCGSGQLYPVSRATRCFCMCEQHLAYENRQHLACACVGVVMEVCQWCPASRTCPGGSGQLYPVSCAACCSCLCSCVFIEIDST
jgi:hypothetical protein